MELGHYRVIGAPENNDEQGRIELNQVDRSQGFVWNRTYGDHLQTK